jgi:hypothetical protein
MRRYFKAGLGLLADQWCKYPHNPKHSICQTYQAPQSWYIIMSESSYAHILLLRKLLRC